MGKYVAEFVGTFLLACAVSASISGKFAAVPTPVIAALTLGVCVYTMGAISGTHINPAVTLGILAIGKISVKDAVIYWVAQFAGGVAAMLVSGAIAARTPLTVIDNGMVFLGEALGTFVLAYGVASVVHDKAPGAAAGLTIGGSLLVGISLAATQSNGVLNPAVALGIGSFSWTYIAGPALGGLLAMVLYRFVATSQPAPAKAKASVAGR
jgi:glycerol uptake facilitator-like aquaporin